MQAVSGLYQCLIFLFYSLGASDGKTSAMAMQFSSATGFSLAVCSCRSLINGGYSSLRSFIGENEEDEICAS